MNQTNKVYNTETSGKPLGTGPSRGKPRTMRPRDYYRMNEYQNKKAGESWSSQVAVEQAGEEAYERMTRKSVSQKKPPPAKPRLPPQTPESKVSKTETPPRDEPLYEGCFLGSKPVKKTLCHNLDFSGFPILCKTTYDSMRSKDDRLGRSLPFPIFLHTMTECLNAYLLKHARDVLKVPELIPLSDPETVINVDDIFIPKPIYDYICGIGNAITATNETIFLNIPSIAIPQDEVEASYSIIESGSFGLPTAETHNAYECYVSPWITRRYIEESINNNSSQHFSSYWSPFSEDDLPRNAVVNGNLLGWFPVERMHREALAKLESCEFSNNPGITGRLCHSNYAVAQTSQIMQRMSDTFNIVKAEFFYKENPSLFIFKKLTSSNILPTDTLADAVAPLLSPFSFGASNANKANYFGYKRARTEEFPGTFITVKGLPPEPWIPHINANFETSGPFGPQRQFRDRMSLREANHEEDSGESFLTLELKEWLVKTFTRKKI